MPRLRAAHPAEVKARGPSREPARRTIRLQATMGETQHLNASSRTRVCGTGDAEHLIIMVVVLLLFRAKRILSGGLRGRLRGRGTADRAGAGGSFPESLGGAVAMRSGGRSALFAIGI